MLVVEFATISLKILSSILPAAKINFTLISNAPITK